MRWYRKLPLRFRSLFLKQQTEQDLNEELAFHMQVQIDDYVAHGMDPDAARRAASSSLGKLDRVKEQIREAHRVNFIENLLQDLRFGFRMLRRAPGFSILAVLCLTLGIGANAAVFSWIEGILLRPFPGVAHQERLFALTSTARGEARRDATSSPDFIDLKNNSKLIEAFIGDKIMGTTISIGDRAERAAGSTVSSNYFDALGVHPVLGRGFQAGEDSGRNAHPVVVISYWVWKERLHSDPAVIGKTQILNGVPHTIIGVAPPGFFGTFVGWPIQFWVPASMQETFEPGGYKLEDRGARWIEGFVRLKPGVTREQAQGELSAIARQLETSYPATNRGRGVQLFPLWKTPFNQAGELLPTLRIALAVVLLVLLIACANVGNLLLVRAVARRQEMTVRLAIGAGRHRLIKQMLTEGLILSTIAAVAGIALAFACRNFLGWLFLPSSGAIFSNLRGQLDWRVLAISAGVCVLSTLLFALVPAMQTSKIDIAGSLKSASSAVVGARGISRLRSALVLVQVSLSFILLVGAVLLIRSMERLRTADPGFSTQNVLVTSVDLVAAGYDAQRAKTFQDGLIDRVRSIKGVESAALARVRPFSYNPYSSDTIGVDGYQPAPDERPMAEYNQVGPDYFTTMGVPLIAGREFTTADNETAAPVAIVNEKMVAQYWRGENPIGKSLRVKDKSMRVIGVARTVRYDSFAESPKSFFYVPLRQNFSIRASLNMRTLQPPAAISAALAHAIHALDENLAPAEVITMRESINFTALSSQQIAVALLSIFGGLALLLAAIGLYGVMAYAVSQSTHELGLRMALGARATDLLRLVMSRGLILTAAGVILGAAASLALTRLIGNLLYKVNPRDPLAFGSALAVMTIVALAACFLPAWRATRTNPVQALRD